MIRQNARNLGQLVFDKDFFQNASEIFGATRGKCFAGNPCGSEGLVGRTNHENCSAFCKALGVCFSGLVGNVGVAQVVNNAWLIDKHAKRA